MSAFLDLCKEKEIGFDAKKIDVSWCGLTSLDGIELFTKLEVLVCNENQLISLDVSKNTALKYLNCSFNKHQYTPTYYSLYKIEIGCKTNTFEFWDNFFLGNCTIEYETKRGTKEFEKLVIMWVEFKKELGL